MDHGVLWVFLRRMQGKSDALRLTHQHLIHEKLRPVRNIERAAAHVQRVSARGCTKTSIYGSHGASFHA